MVERDLERAEMMQATQDAVLVKKELGELNDRYQEVVCVLSFSRSNFPKFVSITIFICDRACTANFFALEDVQDMISIYCRVCDSI